MDTAILLESMFKIGKSLSAEKYEREIVPIIVELFKDRLVRSKLLPNVKNYIEHLKPTMCCFCGLSQLQNSPREKRPLAVF